MDDPSSSEPPPPVVKAVVKKKKNSRTDASKSDVDVDSTEKADVAPPDPVAEVPSATAAAAAVGGDPSPLVHSDPQTEAAATPCSPAVSSSVDVPLPRVSISDQPSARQPSLDYSSMPRDPDPDLISRQELIDLKTASDRMIQEMQDRLSHEEDASASLSSTKKKLEGDISNLKKDLENLELSLQKVSHTDASVCLTATSTAFVCTNNRRNKTKHQKITRSAT